jgi:outer membrane protein assembly factor BamB
MKLISTAFWQGCGAAALLFSTIHVPATDWPQWLGAKRDGCCTETGLLKDWPEGGPRLAWKATGLGAGYSGVSVVGNRVYTMADGTDADFIRALDAKTGQVIWSAKVGRPGGGGGYPGPRCTPTVDGALLMALGQHGDLVCVEAATGKELWRHNLAEELGGKMMSGWGYSESPLVDGQQVICTPGGPQGTLAAFDKQSGKLLWRSTDFTDKASYSSAIVETIGGKRQYIQLTDANLAGVEAATGKLLWRGPCPGKVAVIPTPIFADGCVYGTRGYGIGCTMFRVSESGGQFTATQVYDNKVMVNHHGGVVKVGDCLYGYSDGKGWTCQDFKTGQDLWSEKEKLGKGSILYADGRLILRAEKDKGTLVLIEASPKGWTEHGRFDQPDRSSKNSWPHPVIANGQLYIRDQDTLLCYDVKGK